MRSSKKPTLSTLLFLLASASLLIFFSITAHADIQRMFNYQGVLTTSTGDLITQDPITLNFYLYNDSLTAISVWTEQVVTSVIDGKLSHNVGSINPLPDTLFTRFEKLFLEIEIVGSGGVNETLEPRIRIVSSAYAFRVSTVDSASGGTIMGNTTILANVVDNTLTVKNSGIGGAGFFQVSGLSNTNAAVYGTSEAGEDLGCAIHGVLTSNTAGWGSAAVKGENFGENNSGAGVFGHHMGSGYGVYGRNEGEDGCGVYGFSEYNIGIHGVSLYDRSAYFSGGRVQIIGGNDATVLDNTSGMLVVGVTSYENIVLDNNEIMARNNGAVSTLHLQADGGTVAAGGVLTVGLQGIPVPAGYTLVVDGKAVMEEVEVQLSQDWPDYVFEENYDLMPLEMLEEKISENGHLPDVPSAAEVEKNGIPLGQMQTLLLAKVEELTLHLIEMDKKIKKLDDENKLLKEQLTTLDTQKKH